MCKNYNRTETQQNFFMDISGTMVLTMICGNTLAHCHPAS